MKLFVLDPVERSRELLVQRVYDATRKILSKTLDVSDGTIDSLRSWIDGEEPAAIILGPGYYSEIERAVERVRGFFSKVPLAIVLENEIYASEALELRRFLTARLMPIADVAQIGQFILDSLSVDGALSEKVRCRSVVGVTQLKGGVGTTAIALSLAEESAAKGALTALVDLNDVNPHITAYAKSSLSKKRVVAELLQEGGIPKNRLKEIETELSFTNGRVSVFGQPELYRESFHFKADVLENAPSAAEYITALLHLLRERFDAVVIDCGGSWGIASFAALPFCTQVLLVSTADHVALERTVLNLARLYRESDDPLEFDLKRWHLVVNRSSGSAVAPAILGMLEEAGLPADELSVAFLPECGTVKWGADVGGSFYSAASREFQSSIASLNAIFSGATRSVARPKIEEKLPGRLGEKLAEKFIEKASSAVIERRTEVFTPQIEQAEELSIPEPSARAVKPRRPSPEPERESYWNKLQRIVDTLT